MGTNDTLTMRLVADADFGRLCRHEERRRRFNVFDVMGQSRMELCHSKFLGWLLDPSASHGCGHLFLRHLPSEMSKAAIPEVAIRDAFDAARVMTEHDTPEGRLDVVVEFDPQVQVAVVIEYKVEAGEGEDQLVRYDRFCEQRYATWTVCKWFITPEGRGGSGGAGWQPIGFEKLSSAIRALAKSDAVRDAIVLELILHYCDTLELLAFETSSKPRIVRRLSATLYSDDLDARQVWAALATYSNQSVSESAVRAVLELQRRARAPIRLDGVHAEVARSIAAWLGDSDAWVGSVTSSVRAVPRAWLDRLPSTGDGSGGNRGFLRDTPRAWCFVEVWEQQEGTWYVSVIVARTNPPSDASKVAAVLSTRFGYFTRSRDESDWKKFNHTKVYHEPVLEKRDVQACLEAIKAEVRKIASRLAEFPTEIERLFPG